MKLIEVKSLVIPEVKVVRFGRFKDERGYFTEPYRSSDLHEDPRTDFLHDVKFLQQNESYSTAGVIRGLHFQWTPHMGKFVRTIRGRMVDMVMDIRKGSPTLGHIIAYALPDSLDADYSEWIWVPPGFAHGNYFTVESTIEYFCTAEYSPTTESGISPLAPDIDWSDIALRFADAEQFDTDLMKLPEPTLLRSFIAEHWTPIEIFERQVLRQTTGNQHTRDTRGTLGTKGNFVSAFIGEAVHLLRDNVGGIAKRTTKHIGKFKNWCRDFLITEPFRNGPPGFLYTAMRAALLRQDVACSSNGLQTGHISSFLRESLKVKKITAPPKL